MIQEGIISIFYNYSIILAFIAGLAVGDLMIFLGILAGAGKVNFFLIIIAAFIGGVIHDSLMYLVANTSFIHRIKKRFKLSKKRNKMAKFIEKIGKGHYFLPILLAKFVYGVRDAVIIYVAHNHKNFKKFLFTVALADLIWLFVITSIGWLAGKGFSIFLKTFRGFEKLLFVIVAAAIFIYIVDRFILSAIVKYLKKKLKKIN